MQTMIDNVLHRIAKHGADGFAIDTSGIWMQDRHLCGRLGKLATLASIMGVPSAPCGFSTAVLRTL